MVDVSLTAQAPPAITIALIPSANLLIFVLFIFNPNNHC
ncbi:hypothetical protein D8I24_2790 (plasmid) [Cupriavidus necator H850]|nr:hypothetical protein D8I24_2790 [Cupriavidus necator H850]